MKIPVLVGVLLLLVPVAAQGEAGSDSHLEIGDWHIAAEPDRKLCKMYRVWGSSVDKHKEGLFFRYDAAKEDVWVTWTTDQVLDLPDGGQADLAVEFVRGKSLNQSWGVRTFGFKKHAETSLFSHTISGRKNASRMLRDLAVSNVFGLFSGPTLLTALALDASEAVARLRECSSKAAEPTLPS